MALLKNIKRRGIDAGYIYIESLRFSKGAKQASAILALCVDQEHRNKVKRGETQPIEGHLATVRLTGDVFDEYFPDGVKAAQNIEGRIFKAIKDGKAAIKMDEMGIDPELLATAESDE